MLRILSAVSPYAAFVALTATASSDCRLLLLPPLIQPLLPLLQLLVRHDAVA